MTEYIEREALLAHLRECKETSTGSGLTVAVITAIQSFVKEMPLADVAPVVHGHPIYHNRPVYYERYERADHGENGEPLYRHKCFLLQDNPVAYCSRCGKRLCSNFEDYCPACGAKIDGKGEDDAG